MKVTFVHCTPNAENLIVEMARVSNPANQKNYATSGKLLRYLIKHKHWSPFEMASLCVKIETERDIAAQILRHRSFSFQEFSTRYAEVENYPTVPVLRRQDKTNKQNSIDDIPINVKIEFLDRITKLYNDATNLYKDMLDAEVAKETARRILPLSTKTTLYMHGTLRSWIHYLQIRCSVETQKEHRDVAAACCSIFMQQFPIIGSVIFNSEE